MARGKNIDKKESLHKMVEALVKGDTEEASQHLHAYLNVKTREILVGEAEECEEETEKKDEKEEKEEKDEDEKEEKSEESEKEEKDEDEKEEVEEGFAAKGHGPGAMSRSVSGKVQFAHGGKKTVRKHGNASTHLDDKVKGKVKFENGGKSTVRKHGNAAPHLEPKVKGKV